MIDDGTADANFSSVKLFFASKINAWVRFPLAGWNFFVILVSCDASGKNYFSRLLEVFLLEIFTALHGE